MPRHRRTPEPRRSRARTRAIAPRIIVGALLVAGATLGTGHGVGAGPPDENGDPAGDEPDGSNGDDPGGDVEGTVVLRGVRIVDAEGVTSQPVPAAFAVRLTPSTDPGGSSQASGSIICQPSASDPADEDNTADAEADGASGESETEDDPVDPADPSEGFETASGGQSWTCDRAIGDTRELVAELGIIEATDNGDATGTDGDNGDATGTDDGDNGDATGNVDDEANDDFRKLLDQRGNVDASPDGISVAFRSGRGLVSSVRDDIVAGPVAITYPRDCGEGAVAGTRDGTNPIVLLIDTDTCPTTERLTIRLPDGAGYEIEAPEAGITSRAQLDLTTPAIGRGGPVTISQPGTEPVSAQRGLRLAFSVDERPCGESDINENNAYAVSLREPCSAELMAGVAMIDTDLTTAVDLGVAPILGVEFVVPEGRRLAMGRAQSNEASLPEGTTITVEVADGGLACGNSVVQRDGAYLILLGAECGGAGVSLRARAPDGRTAPLSLPDDGSPTVNLVFTDDSGPPTTTAPTSQQREEPLLKSWQVIVILSSILFITVVALLLKWDAARRRGVANLVRTAADSGLTADDIKLLAKAESESEPSFRLAFELALLAFVTVALVTLTLGGTLTEQGVLTILSAIVGYAAGRASSGGDRE